MVKVLVGESRADRFTYSWFEFEGEEVSSFEDKGILYTLFKHTDPAYTAEAYRVHISDERKLKAPAYRLEPGPGDRSPYSRRDIADKHPRFVKDMRPVQVSSL